MLMLIQSPCLIFKKACGLLIHTRSQHWRLRLQLWLRWRRSRHWCEQAFLTLFHSIVSFSWDTCHESAKNLRQTNSLNSSGVEAIIICEQIPLSLNSHKLILKHLDVENLFFQLKKEGYSIGAEYFSLCNVEIVRSDFSIDIIPCHYNGNFGENGANSWELIDYKINEL